MTIKDETTSTLISTDYLRFYRETHAVLKCDSWTGTGLNG